MTRIFLSLITFAALALPLAASANDFDDITVSALVSDNCTITAGALDFGAYDPVDGSAIPGSAALTVACTEGGTFNITLGQGDNPTGTSTDAAPERQMTDGTDNLAYTLYQEELHSNIWGNTELTGVDYVAADSSGHEVDVWGVITAGQSVESGSYGDTVRATIAF